MASKTTNKPSPKPSAPKAHHNGKRTFTLQAPGASSVSLVGDFTQWQQSPILMKKGDDGLWHAEVNLVPGQHRYRFLVDGEWRDDPACTTRVPNEFGSEDCVCQAG